MSWSKAAKETFKRNGECFETDLTDEEWAQVEPFLPPPPLKRGQRRRTDLRKVFNAIQYLLGTECLLRTNPPCFPLFTTVQNYDYARRNSGVFETMMDGLRGQECGPEQGRSPAGN